tara:strand:+ start:1399 stop:1575 length:177 start_codon:yes stop_codon:yes gene_type:complete
MACAVFYISKGGRQRLVSDSDLGRYQGEGWSVDRKVEVDAPAPAEASKPKPKRKPKKD